MSGIGRRAFLAVPGLALRAPAAAAATRPVRLTLPAPSGPLRIGTRAVRLIDRSRRDPWTRRSRELMVSLWYPAARAHGFRRTPWLPPAAAALYRKLTSRSLGVSLDTVDFPHMHAAQGARAKGRHPVILFSPAFGALRAFGTALVEDLASHGYIVVTIDHTYEAQLVEFPRGRIERSRIPEDPTDADIALALRVRVADTRFVLDQFPAGSNVGMYGHSLGGDTAAETMAQDRRIVAGADLDGSINGPVTATGLDRPFLLMSSAGHSLNNDPSWAEFWSHLRGWRRLLELRDSGHETYTDLVTLVRQLERALPISAEVTEQLTGLIGTIGANRAIAVQRAYVRAFFDLHLRGRDTGLLSGPSPRYPEIEFVD